ncbi:PEP-CTERM sorting domain-containing protein [Colwellia psychrerythraea]|uniref:Ice-binding protein C-terminal domain-containing protein n=1 Tax=Colwellia psychrerythraea (strain 34H / ATCC BAA-681) TaxID=167879 RepID=Q47VU7_COLP3|nr:PEP-CTERM sorting domain-containing protein [Colwellia psychrerythraea]AAZ28718.1 hypothetical protein CPS_4426 [Colwellia psychrerythraea 34H]
MKPSNLLNLFSPLLISLMFLSPTANAGLITSDLGNATSGLVDGNSYALIPDILTAQAGQPAPFDAGIGSELFGDPANVNWLFNYGAITDTILSASFSFGIWDHDSAASGSQLDAFSLGSIDTTVALDAMFESGGGATDAQYSVYTFNLGATFFADLADGNFSVDLDIGGAGLQTALMGGQVSETATNGYHLIYSSLNIVTEDSGPGPIPVPEPSTLLLFVLSLAGLKARIK